MKKLLLLFIMAMSLNFAQGQNCHLDCPGDKVIYLDAGDCSWAAEYDARTENCNPSYDTISTDPTLTDGIYLAGGPAQGELVYHGTTATVVLQLLNGGQVVDECSFDVTVHEFQNPVSTLACNDNVQVSVDNDCLGLVTPDMILEGGPYSCYDNYEVRIYNSMPSDFNAPGNVANPAPLGSFVVGVFDETGNNCWGSITVMDKIAPTIECNCPEGGAFPAGAVVPAIITGDFSTNDLTANIHKDCWDFGDGDQTPDHGNHYFDLYPIQVSATGIYTFEGTDGNKMLIGIFDEHFNAVSSCDNLIDGMGGYVLGMGLFFEEPQNGGAIDNTVNLTAGHTYYVVVTDFNADFEGTYSFSITPPTAGDEVTFAKTIYDSDCEYIGCFEEGVDYNFMLPSYWDNCSADLTWTQTVEDGLDCGTYIVKRVYTVTDGSGSTATCTSEYFFKGIDVSNMEWPTNWDGLPNNHPMLECNSGYDVDAQGNPDPGFTGYPSGYNDACGTIEVFYNDQVYDLDCGTKILRYWTVVDDCTGAIYEHIQIIRITDYTAPTFLTPDDIVAKTKAYECNADITVGLLHVADNCDPNPKWWVTTTAGIIIGDANHNGFVDAGETWKVINVPLGDYALCYHAIDNCGNEAVECVNINIFDGVPPIPVCEQHKQVSVTAMGNAKVFAYSFDSGSFDNCNPVYFKVLRVNDDLIYDGGCPDLNGDDKPSTATNDVWYDDDVFFCCEDVDNSVMVSLRVYDIDPGVGPVHPNRTNPGGDLYGHYNDCWSIVNVECKIPPVLDCPPITVSCEESLDPEENPRLWPNVVSVCGYELDYTDVRDLGVCGAHIVRTWTATGCNKTTQCRQRISVDETEAFDPCTIRFPRDITADCADQLGEGGEPTWDENPCNVVAAEFTDDTFKFVEDACYKIIRHWAVIDWCLYESNTGAEDNIDAIINRRLDCNRLVEDGYYRYTQILMVTDSEAPSITVEDQCIATTDCYAYDVELNAHATDECNVDQKFNWKYIVTNMDTWETVQYSYNYTPRPGQGRKGKRYKDNLDRTADASLVILDPLPFGYYKVTWTVGDGCGNATSKDQFFTIADKKAPTPILVDIATAVMANGMVELKAKSFDKGGCENGCISSRDNCTPSDKLFFTFTEFLPKLEINPIKWNKQLIKYGMYFFDPETGLISTLAKYEIGEAHAWLPDQRTSQRRYFCDYVAEGNYSKTVTIYVWDQFAYDEDCDDGNYDFANVIVNFNHCDSEPYPLVSGMVSYANTTETFEGMEINADNGESVVTVSTDVNGRFAFNLSPGNYSIDGSKDVNYLNGVTTLDLVIIQKYILGIKEITSPYKLIAADANKNGQVSASDLLEIRKVILGAKNEFVNNSWVAISTDYIFHNPANAAAEAEDARARKITAGVNSMTDLDFVAVKIGDLNGSASTLENRNAGNIKLLVDNVNMVKGQEIEIPFYANDFNSVYGAQFTMNIANLNVTEIKPGALNITDNNINIVNDNLVLSWNDAQGKYITDGEILFTMIATAKTNSNLNSILTINDNVARSEAYVGEELEINTISLEYRNADINYALYQNEPNPFAAETTIGFDLPKSSQYTITVYDVTGKVVTVVNNTGQAGYNSIVLSNKDIKTTGVLYYRLESGDYTATKKMILIK